MIKLTKRDIKDFFASRNRVFRGSILLLRLRKISKDNPPRFAFIVSSAVKRNAPTKNLVRRRMSEIARVLLPKIKTGYDIVFSYKLQNKKAPSFLELKNDIINLLTLCGAL